VRVRLLRQRELVLTRLLYCAQDVDDLRQCVTELMRSRHAQSSVSKGSREAAAMAEKLRFPQHLPLSNENLPKRYNSITLVVKESTVCFLTYSTVRDTTTARADKEICRLMCSRKP